MSRTARNEITNWTQVISEPVGLPSASFQSDVFMPSSPYLGVLLNYVNGSETSILVDLQTSPDGTSNWTNISPPGSGTKQSLFGGAITVTSKNWTTLSAAAAGWAPPLGPYMRFNITVSGSILSPGTLSMFWCEARFD